MYTFLNHGEFVLVGHDGGEEGSNVPLHGRLVHFGHELDAEVSHRDLAESTVGEALCPIHCHEDPLAFSQAHVADAALEYTCMVLVPVGGPEGSEQSLTDY